MKKKLENAPALDIDKVLFKTRPIPPHVVRERRIVWNFLKHLEANSITPRRTNNGDEVQSTPTKKAVMEVLFNCDDARVYFTKGWVYFVLGNDVDTISDYSVDLEPIISKFNPEAFV